MSTRRDFLKTSAQAGAVGAAAAAGDFAFLNNLPPLSAQDVRRALAPVQADVEPLVRLIEDTAAERLLPAMAERIRNGVSYQQILAALMLAGVRGIQPRPVGFKFHAVLVVNSAHLASLAAADRDRWLPLFWGMDNFKRSQARNAREGDWRMSVLADNRLPAPEHAVRNFRTAMDGWEVENADRAIAQVARVASLNEVYEMMWRYGARDFRDIGHKAIFVANSYRTLVTIGWRHAEPILRSLAYALVDSGRDANPARNDHAADRPGRDNLRRLTRIRAGWQRGRVTREAVTDLLATLRNASAADAAEAVLTKINERIDPSCVWDAIFLFAGELLMKQPGIVGLHTITTMNALAFGYQTTASDETRRFLMLQAASFLTMFRARMGELPANPRIDTLEAGELMGQGQAAVDDIFATASTNKLQAARKTLALLTNQASQLAPLMTTARRLIFAKGNDSHDYKFSSAALEDFYHVSPAWRNRFLAASTYWLKGSGGADSPVLRRTRAALGNN
ncbi:MAG: twin-arginine translocation signal domain-containing protein [Planctomycetes bacterium]|nr:twin-arginine translocation signal domain-containing protein [Planctomycetota bacterium]